MANAYYLVVLALLLIVAGPATAQSEQDSAPFLRRRLVQVGESHLRRLVDTNKEIHAVTLHDLDDAAPFFKSRNH
jgi:hypothetical protein